MQHEHCRDDRDGFVLIHPKELEQNARVPLDNYDNMTADVHPGRYDSASIMHYSGCGSGFGPGPRAWSAIGQREQLSQLDKHFMNKLYPPVPGYNGYHPRRGTTGLFYCGRRVMMDNNFPYGRVGCDGRCGPTNGPNCPSCVAYGISQGDGYPQVTSDGRKQGDTGLFYCGKKMSCKETAVHNGYCGPNNGPCCEDCFKVLGPRAKPLIVSR